MRKTTKTMNFESQIPEKEGSRSKMLQTKDANHEKSKDVESAVDNRKMVGSCFCLGLEPCLICTQNPTDLLATVHVQSSILIENQKS